MILCHIFIIKEEFDFIYNLSNTLCSSICCSITNFLLKFLFLSQNDIKNLNNIKNENEKNIFFLLIFIFMGLFHIYVITFCAVYINTQKHLIKSTLISFMLSMVYPFGISLISNILRKLSLYCENKFLFFCSKILI